MSHIINEQYLYYSNFSIAMLVNNIVSIDSRVLKTALTLSKSGFRVHVFGLNRTNKRKKLEGYPFKVILLPNPKTQMIEEGVFVIDEKENYYEFLQRTSNTFIEELKYEKYDILHTHDMFCLTIGAALKKNNENFKLGWIHDIHEYVEGSTHIPDEKRTLYVNEEKKYIANPNKLITVCPILSEKINKKYKVNRPCIIYNTPRICDFDIYYPKKIRDHLKLDDDTPLLVYCGNVSHYRGIHVVLESLKSLPNVHFAILTHHKRQFVKKLIATSIDLQISDRFHVIPYIPHNEVTSFIAGATAGIFPILDYGNADLALPNKIFEYLHAGLPIISSNTTAMNSFFKKYGCGVTFNIDNCNSFIEAVNKVIVKYPYGLKNINEHSSLAYKFSWEQQEKVLLSLYSELLDKVEQENNTCFERDNFSPILFLPVHAANQPGTLAKEAKKQNISATFAAMGENPFKYRNEIDIGNINCNCSTIDQPFVDRYINKYNTFHFHVKSFLFNKNYSFPTGLDLLLLKAMKKKVFFHFRGSEIRLATVFKEKSPYNYVDKKDDKNNKMPFKFNEAKQKEFRDYICGICDEVFVPDPEIQCYVPNSLIIPRVFDLSLIENQEKDDNCLKIIHAPSRSVVKGTKHVIAAIERLKKEGFKFDFELIENLSHDKSLIKYKEASIIIDQLLIGWYGVLAVEGMALGKAVVSYIRNDLRSYLPYPCPLAIANPENLYCVLKGMLENPESIKQLGKLGREFVEDYHDSTKIMKLLIRIYSKPMKPINPIQAANYLNYQNRNKKTKKRKKITSKIKKKYLKFYKVAKKENFLIAIYKTLLFIKKKHKERS